jgi:hypothetical protein
LTLAQRLQKLEAGVPMMPRIDRTAVEELALAKLLPVDLEMVQQARPRVSLATSNPALWAKWGEALRVAQTELHCPVVFEQPEDWEL